MKTGKQIENSFHKLDAPSYSDTFMDKRKRVQNHDCKIEKSININMMMLRFWAY